MKRPTVDYRGFRLSRLNEPRFRHLKLLGGWIGYFVLYFLTENLIPAERCHPIHCALDDLIPFNEFFVIFYVSWYLLIVGSLLYFMLYDVESFRKEQIFIMITQAVAMLCYILWPSRQDLRPEIFLRDNALTRLMAFIYSFDTSTGVCPSLHVAYSLGILSVFWKYRGSSPLWKGVLLVWVVLICAAVCFVKQHSALDILAALPVALLAEALLYGRSYWLPRLRAKRRGEG
ncbi:MAG: phosphatidic acid phosphatase [Oscillospiraceae bacterium]|nr:phosphatidic acid phosphatase [Oscillospiraceae bacterium]